MQSSVARPLALSALNPARGASQRVTFRARSFCPGPLARHSAWRPVLLAATVPQPMVAFLLTPHGPCGTIRA